MEQAAEKAAAEAANRVLSRFQAVKTSPAAPKTKAQLVEASLATYNRRSLRFQNPCKAEEFL